MTPINQSRHLQFPWNRKGAAREHVLDFLALAWREVGNPRATVDVAAARHTLAWLRLLLDVQKDQLP